VTKVIKVTKITPGSLGPNQLNMPELTRLRRGKPLFAGISFASAPCLNDKGGSGGTGFGAYAALGAVYWGRTGADMVRSLDRL
jgi:hypothetical protein